MQGLILNLYEFLTVGTPVLILYFITKKHREQKKGSVAKLWLILIFSVYICGVFHFTWTGTLYNMLVYGLRMDQNQINYLPFSHDIDITGYLLNILLFMPLGFLLPFLWDSARKLNHIFFYGFSLSLVVELSQLLNNRQTDIDDLLLNTAGALLGYLGFCIVARIFNIQKKSTGGIQYEPALYLTVMFLSHFFLFHEFAAVRILYNL